MDIPAPAQSWAAFNDFNGLPMAYWAMLDLVPPGTTTPGLYYESTGLPGIVNYWAGGEVPPKGGEEDEPNPSAPPNDPLVTEMINGKTVGVEPWPADRSSQALLARLRSLTQTSCAAPLSWVTDSGLCSQLIQDLDSAEAYRASGAATQARTSLLHFGSLLTGTPPGSYPAGVSSSAYWLLKPNADVIVGLM